MLEEEERRGGEEERRICEEEPDPEHLFSPAHDLVCQQHSAHLWVLVLAFVNNGL